MECAHAQNATRKFRTIRKCQKLKTSEQFAVLYRAGGQNMKASHNIKVYGGKIVYNNRIIEQ